MCNLNSLSSILLYDGPTTLTFIRELSHWLSTVKENNRTAYSLLQRIAFAVVRGNTLTIQHLVSSEYNHSSQIIISNNVIKNTKLYIMFSRKDSVELRTFIKNAVNYNSILGFFRDLTTILTKYISLPCRIHRIDTSNNHDSFTICESHEESKYSYPQSHSFCSDSSASDNSDGLIVIDIPPPILKQFNDAASFISNQHANFKSINDKVNLKIELDCNCPFQQPSIRSFISTYSNSSNLVYLLPTLVTIDACEAPIVKTFNFLAIRGKFTVQPNFVALKVKVHIDDRQTLKRIVSGISRGFGTKWHRLDPITCLVQVNGSRIGSIEQLVDSNPPLLFGFSSNRRSLLVDQTDNYLPVAIGASDIEVILNQLWPDHPCTDEAVEAWRRDRLTSGNDNDEHVNDARNRAWPGKALPCLMTSACESVTGDGERRRRQEVASQLESIDTSHQSIQNHFINSTACCSQPASELPVNPSVDLKSERPLPNESTLNNQSSNRRVDIDRLLLYRCPTPNGTPILVESDPNRIECNCVVEGKHIIATIHPDPLIKVEQRSVDLKTESTSEDVGCFTDTPPSSPTSKCHGQISTEAKSNSKGESEQLTSVDCQLQSTSGSDSGCSNEVETAVDCTPLSNQSPVSNKEIDRENEANHIPQPSSSLQASGSESFVLPVGSCSAARELVVTEPVAIADHEELHQPTVDSNQPSSSSYPVKQPICLPHRMSRLNLAFVPDARLFHQRFHISRILGDGNFAVVRLARDRRTLKRYALKIIDKAKVKGKEYMVQSEIDILHRCRHNSIVQLIEEYESPCKIWLLIEYLKGGDLFEAISRGGKFNEPSSAWIVGDLASALFYLHSRSIVHRDLKPENVLLWTDSENRTRVKLADFGLAVEIFAKQKLTTMCGTPTYIAPEILRERGYGVEVDLWALGVIAYIMLCGFAPFRASNRRQSKLFALIKQGNFAFVSPYWDSISADAKQLVSSLLTLAPDQRLTAFGCLTNLWVFTKGECQVANNIQLDEQQRNIRRRLSTYRLELEGQRIEAALERRSQLASCQHHRGVGGSSKRQPNTGRHTIDTCSTTASSKEGNC